ncbi:MAG: hypothetical protein RL205_592 [Actinomycetota bacterium]
MSMAEFTHKVPDLLVMRHSKSAYPLGVEDHDRPLNDRGRRDALAARQWFAQQALVIDQAWVSSAARAQSTWSGVEPGIMPSARAHFAVRTVPELYEASVGRLLSLLSQSTASTLMVVAHNPGLEQLIDHITARDPHDWLPQIREKYPTGAICALRLPQWSAIGEATAELLTYAVPRAS